MLDMEGNSIIMIVLALCLSASMAALFVCAVRLSRERRKTSIFYGISTRDLETDPMRCGGRMEEVSAQELRGIADGLAECSGLVRSLLRKGLDDAEFLALAERLQALSEEVEHLTFKHNKS